MQTRASSSSRMARFKWVIGTPYAVQGSSHLVEVPILYFIKFTLGMGDAGGQLFNSLRNLGWFVKPVWGYISDRFPLFGYHRKSWFILMALLATAFWVVTAGFAAIGVRIPAVFLLTFNLAFATYAFVDVVCDALMVTEGRRVGRVGALVNFQWTVLATVNAGAVLLGSWFQQQVQSGEVSVAWIFLATGIPPLFTAAVGWRNIAEARVERSPAPQHARPLETKPSVRTRLRRILHSITRNRTLLLLTLFVFFWNFSPSVGYIERSYLIDVRAFEPTSFGMILSVGGVTFLVSILAYRWVVHRFPSLAWYHYLYAMIALGLLSFPLSFFIYLDPDHPWWDPILALIPPNWEPVAGWNRYEWFRLIFQTVLGFATIPAFIIPLTLAGETVRLEHAGVGYAFLMALANVTNMLEGTVGAGLYHLFQLPFMDPVVSAFAHSPLAIAQTPDERTVILQLFIYISVGFTLLAIVFVELLRRHFVAQGIRIDLAGRGEKPDGDSSGPTY